MSDLKNLDGVIRALIDQHGVFAVRSVCQRIFRERVDKARDPRKKFSWAITKRLYQKQNGVCEICRQDMPLIRGRLHVDHIDSQRVEGFNDPDNLRCVHKDCNLSKGAKSLNQISKETGRTVVEQL